MANKNLLEMLESLLKVDNRSVQMIVRRYVSSMRNSNIETYRELSTKLNFTNNMRGVESGIKPAPVDPDSRLNLIRMENPVIMDNFPIHSINVKESLNQVLLEREHSNLLIIEGLSPSKSIIFQGPPGVGKTISARWIANQLGLPLLVLDLATVISSFLGKTGSNIRSVIDYATSFPCVLLLDEFDAIAKRRDDDRELGELKRLVTVLLQAIDDWPESSLLIAATNHGDLLDPAIWRRFDLEVSFDLPDKKMLIDYLSMYWPDVNTDDGEIVNKFTGKSFSYVDRELRRAKRSSVLSGLSLGSCLFSEGEYDFSSMNRDEKKQIIKKLSNDGLSQRAIATKLEISRPTVKKILDQIISDEE